VGQLTGDCTDEPTHRQPYFFISPSHLCVSISNKTSFRDSEIEYVTDRTNQQTATVHLTNIANNNKNKYK